MERRSKATLEMISQKLNAWELRKEYLQTGITIIKMAKALGINRTYLSNFINQQLAERTPHRRSQETDADRPAVADEYTCRHGRIH